MAKKDIYERSLIFHKKHQGKVSTVSRVPIRNRDDLSLSYTPGVARVCEVIAKHPQDTGLYTLKSRTVAIVSDGSAILGLGNLGAKAAIPVMEGKAILFKEFGGVDAFPLCLDTQDTEEIIRTVKLLAPVFGGINLEDISAPRCFEIEKRLRAELDIPVMHDDQHGTAVVVLAALINALKVKKLSINKAQIVISGAGAAGMAVARLLLGYGVKHLILLDSEGAIYNGRKGLSPEKRDIARHTNLHKEKGALEEVIKNKDVFIGVSKPGVLTKAMIQTMRPKPIIFALANPVPEIMPDEAVAGGALVVATGRSDFPNQINNLLAFPGIFRGALEYGVRTFDEMLFIRVAEAIASMVKRPQAGKIIPDTLDKRVAKKVVRVFKQ